MPNLNDYHAYKSTSGGSGNFGTNKGLGCGGLTVIVIVVVLLIFFVADGASWDAIDTLLCLGLIAFLVARSLFS